MFLIGLAFAMLHGSSVVFDRSAVHQAYAIGRALQPLEERVPVNTRWLHGDEHPFTFVPEDLFPKGGFKQSETFSGVGEFKLP